MKTENCEFLSVCQTDCSGTLEDTEMCHCFELYKQIKVGHCRPGFPPGDASVRHAEDFGELLLGKVLFVS